MSAHRGPAIKCVCCWRPGRHAGRGLVDACFARHKRHGTLDQFPRVYQVAADTQEEHAFLSSQGLSDDQIAGRLGLTLAKLRYALERAA